MSTRRSRPVAFAAGALAALLATTFAAGVPAGAEGDDHPKPPRDRDGAVTLTLLHNNDGESSLLSSLNTVTAGGAEVALPVGGIGAFKAVTDREIAGAAIVFANPLFTTDPGAGIAALLDSGFTLDEITSVADRVVELEEEASATCKAEEPAED